MARPKTRPPQLHDPLPPSSRREREAPLSHRPLGLRLPRLPRDRAAQLLEGGADPCRDGHGEHVAEGRERAPTALVRGRDGLEGADVPPRARRPLQGAPSPRPPDLAQQMRGARRSSARTTSRLPGRRDGGGRPHRVRRRTRACSRPGSTSSSSARTRISCSSSATTTTASSSGTRCATRSSAPREVARSGGCRRASSAICSRSWATPRTTFRASPVSGRRRPPIFSPRTARSMASTRTSRRSPRRSSRRRSLTHEADARLSYELVGPRGDLDVAWDAGT
jgi:hypothetical protein